MGCCRMQRSRRNSDGGWLGVVRSQVSKSRAGAPGSLRGRWFLGITALSEYRPVSKDGGGSHEPRSRSFAPLTPLRGAPSCSAQDDTLSAGRKLRWFPAVVSQVRKSGPGAPGARRMSRRQLAPPQVVMPWLRGPWVRTPVRFLRRSTSMRTWAPCRTSPSRILMASGSCTMRCSARFSGRAP